MIKNIAKTIYNAVPGKPLAFRILRSMIRPSQKTYRHLHFKGPFEVVMPAGGRFAMIHFGHEVENDLFWAGYGNGWERTSLRVWEAMAKNAHIIFDIGANTGTYALAAKAMNPLAHVDAFEPVARIFESLSANVALNLPNIKPHCIALSDRTGSATLFDSGDEHLYSASLNHAMLGKKGERAKMIVPVQTIDDYCDTNEILNVDLMKIDTEMHEPEVLRGAQKVLSRDRPAILIEILNTDIGQKVADLMPGYRFFQICEGKGLLSSENLGASGERNYLALHGADPRCDAIGDSIPEDQVNRLA